VKSKAHAELLTEEQKEKEIPFLVDIVMQRLSNPSYKPASEVARWTSSDFMMIDHPSNQRPNARVDKCWLDYESDERFGTTSGNQPRERECERSLMTSLARYSKSRIWKVCKMLI